MQETNPKALKAAYYIRMVEGWLSSEEKNDSHDYFASEGLNKIRFAAKRPRMIT